MERVKNIKNPDGTYLMCRTSLLALGLALTFFSDMRGSAEVVAWFMPVPFLIYATRYRKPKDRLWLLLVLVAASMLVLAKSASTPLLVSLGFSVMAGTVIGLHWFLTYIIWERIRRRTCERSGILAFPVVAVSFEYLQAFFTPFGDWGALANTQISNLPLLQTASLVGFLGISALMAWFSVLVASVLLKGSFSGLKVRLAVFGVVFLLLNVWGDLRLDQIPDGRYARLSAITNDFVFTGTIPDPDSPVVARTTDMMVANTQNAARQGAELAVWGEASTVVSQDGEKTLLDRLRGVAMSEQIAIVAAYIVKLPTGSRHGQENKFIWIDADGTIVETYLKHHPVPFEGSEPGIAPLRTVATPFGNIGGAICYDFDFPRGALSFARVDADLVVLPGLDWRGMFRRHSLMVRMRAIEGGFPVLRAGNEATSMAFDDRGRILASLPSFGPNDRQMSAYMPIGHNVTLYSRIGNSFAYLALLILAGLLIMTGRNRLSEK